MKKLFALVAALGVTTLVALGMLVIGLNAFFNPNSVPPSDSANSPAPAAIVSSADAQTQISQLQAQVAQYQSREQQYQTQLQQVQSQNQQLNTQVQQLKNVINQLQRMGIIRIQSDGTIQLRVRGDD